ncbi:MAG: hypothetical protein M0T74_15785 [Desulfitobacterium hafniense]|nr:hypothetical protein [Desulfitobacterium hafniense]
MKNETIKMSYEDMTSSRDSYMRISVLENNKRNEQNILVQSSFTSLLNWLKDQGYYDQFALHLEDIESVELQKAEDRAYSDNAATRSPVTINEREMIEELLNIDPSTNYISNDVSARFNVRNHVWIKRISLEAGVSAKLKGYFAELEEEN